MDRDRDRTGTPKGRPVTHRDPHDRSGPPDPSRRRFLKAAGLGVAIGVGGSVALRLGGVIGDDGTTPWDPGDFPPPGRARVAVLEASSYDRDLEGTVGDGLTAIGAYVRGARVVLKPNLVEFDPEVPINTDPRLVAATAVALRRLGASSVTVAEAPGHRRDLQYVASRSGLLEALAEVGTPFVDLNTVSIRRVPLETRYTPLGELWLPETLVDADVVISMPKMKTHHWADVTLSLKNCFGCLPGRVYGWPKNVLHWVGIQNSILDIATAVRPRYAIVDGIVGMEGNGPISGSPVQAGVLVFGDDPVATDSIAATLMGFDPETVPYLAEAGRFLGQLDRAEIADAGEDPDALAMSFERAPTAEIGGRTG
jgi:uncharacterized protein (DUF362 family)